MGRATLENPKLGQVARDMPYAEFLATDFENHHVEWVNGRVVEIISPDYRGVDRGEKFYEYEKGGVPEYWLIDPERKQTEFYLRDKKGIYRLAGLDDKGIYHSTMMPGLWIDPDWFWKSPLPTVLSIQKLWGLV